jgi:O-Antigen ligase
MNAPVKHGKGPSSARGCRVSGRLDPADVVTRFRPWTYRLLFLIHLPLGVLMKEVPSLVTFHGLAVLLGGLVWIYWSRRPMAVAWVVAYTAGAELLWRISGGSVFWELGKLSAVLACSLGIIIHPKITHFGSLLLLYLAGLVPGVFLGIFNGYGDLKDNISVNLSGPVSLVLIGFYFSGLSVSRQGLKQLLLCFLLPFCSSSIVLLTSLAAAGDVTFSTSSNFSASGGYGPVQVSSYLAAGCLVSFLFCRLPNLSRTVRILMTVIGMLWLAQTAMTFSRSGVYIFCGSIAVSIPLLAMNRGQRQNLIETIFVYAIVIALLIPYLVQITGGALEERFSSSDTTGRADMAHAEWEAFLEHPITGMGLGAAAQIRLETFGKEVSSHTELTRLLSEHGLLGALNVILLVGIPVIRFWLCRDSLHRVFIASSAVYTLLFMATCGMRLVVVSFIYSLVVLPWRESARYSHS